MEKKDIVVVGYKPFRDEPARNVALYVTGDHKIALQKVIKAYGSCCELIICGQIIDIHNIDEEYDEVVE